MSLLSTRALLSPVLLTTEQYTSFCQSGNSKNLARVTWTHSLVTVVWMNLFTLILDGYSQYLVASYFVGKCGYYNWGQISDHVMYMPTDFGLHWLVTQATRAIQWISNECVDKIVKRIVSKIQLLLIHRQS